MGAPFFYIIEDLFRILLASLVLAAFIASAWWVTWTKVFPRIRILREILLDQAQPNNPVHNNNNNNDNNHNQNENFHHHRNE